MLIEIICDKFAHGEKGYIPLKNGLNVIQGATDGSNSIGKSSFLLALDFCFGGNEYAKSKDIEENVGEHYIRFCFMFDGQRYCFLRSTKTPNIVCKLESDYKPMYQGEMSVEKFRQFLQKSYKMETPLDEVTDNLFRIYGKNNIDKKIPLELLLKLANLYLEPPQETEQGTTITKKEYDENKSRIEKLLTAILDELISNRSFLTNQDEVVAMSRLKAELHEITRKKKLLCVEYYKIKDIISTKTIASEQDFAELQKYFPDSNIKHFTEIENFHKEITRILKSNLEQEKSKIQAKLNVYDDQIFTIEQRINELTASYQIPETMLELVNNIKQDYQKLKTENIEYESTIEYKEKKREEYKKDIMANIEKLQVLIRGEISKWQPTIDPKNKSPVFTASKHNSYEYKTPNSDGTGTNYKNLLLLDFILLLNTNIPALMQDSMIFHNIENERVERIMTVYAECPKQIFIAVDKIGGFTKNTIAIFNANTILKLSAGIGALYGRSWENIEKPAQISLFNGGKE